MRHVVGVLCFWYCCWLVALLLFTLLLVLLLMFYVDDVVGLLYYLCYCWFITLFVLLILFPLIFLLLFFHVWFLFSLHVFWWNTTCCNLSLGLTTKARACKGAGQKWAWESHFMLSGVQKSVREWTPTFPSELPLWELKFQWNFESSKGNYKGQNSLDWEVHYIIEKSLERKCLKWARMTNLDS
jgi:energy-coupling factor transporter transmembrane protein EcfT